MFPFFTSRDNSQDLGLSQNDIAQTRKAIENLSLPPSENGVDNIKSWCLSAFDAHSAGKYGPLNKLRLISASLAGFIASYEEIIKVQEPVIITFYDKVKERISTIESGMTEREKKLALVTPSLG